MCITVVPEWKRKCVKEGVGEGQRKEKKRINKNKFAKLNFDVKLLSKFQFYIIKSFVWQNVVSRLPAIVTFRTEECRPPSRKMDFMTHFVHTLKINKCIYILMEFIIVSTFCRRASRAHRIRNFLITENSNYTRAHTHTYIVHERASRDDMGHPPPPSKLWQRPGK